MATLFEIQPEDLEPFEYTHFDCWFEDTTINPTLADEGELTDQAIYVLEAWEQSLDIKIDTTNLNFSNWLAVYDSFDTVIHQIIAKGHSVYISEGDFIEIYSKEDSEIAEEEKIWAQELVDALIEAGAYKPMGV